MSKIADLNDVADNGSYSLTHDGRKLLLVKRGEALFLYENSCPHTRETLDPMGGSVASDDGLLLQCQRHAAQFVADSGECVAGPCLGERLEPVPFTVSQEAIYLD